MRYLLIVIAGAATACGVQPDSATRVVAGPLTITLYVSATAHVFHIVDQLAAWSPYCHEQYARYFSDLTDEERALLAEHASLRQQKPWGQGLEQTFYTDLSLEEALKAGVAEGHLTQEQAEIERRVLTAFTPRADALMESHSKELAGFAAALHRRQDDIADIAAKAARLCGIPEIEAPAYAIANPDDQSSGGGFNGGKLTIEVSPTREVMNVFLHEVFHVFLRARDEAITAAAATGVGLDNETLSEGIAYALSPGLLHEGSPQADPLRTRVASDWGAGKTLDDPYTRSNRFGLALRPLLKEALDDKSATLETFLPRAVDAWRVVSELSAAAGKGAQKWEGKKSGSPTVLIFAPDGCNAFPILSTRLQGKSVNTFGRNHQAQFYKEMRDLHAKPGDIVLLLFALDQPDRIPDDYASLLPRPWEDLEKAVKPGEPIVESHEAEQLRITVIVGATCADVTGALEHVDLNFSR